jgi:hypothetical protein
MSYHLECGCIDKNTGKLFVIITNEIKGTCPNCGTLYIVQWNRLNRVRLSPNLQRALKERFYALFGV